LADLTCAFKSMDPVLDGRSSKARRLAAARAGLLAAADEFDKARRALREERS
jgi:hypothetical protein